MHDATEKKKQIKILPKIINSRNAESNISIRISGEEKFVEMRTFYLFVFKKIIDDKC